MPTRIKADITETGKMPLRPALHLMLLITAPSLCMAADWRLIERFQDIEMFYDASSIKRNRDEITVTTLTNYFKARNRGDGEFWSKTTIHTVYCGREKLIPRFSSDHEKHFAGGKVVDEGEIESAVVDAKPKTVAGAIHSAVCRVGA